MKYQPLILYLLTALLLSAAVCACSKDQTQSTLTTQEESISKYIESSFKGYDVIRHNGSNRVIVDPGYGADSLAFGDSLAFYYSGFVFSNGPSTLFATNVRSVAEKNAFYITEQEHTFDEYAVLYESGCFTPGLTEGLYGVKEGEHAIILFSAEYGFYDRPVANVPALSALLYEVWIERIKKNQ